MTQSYTNTYSILSLVFAFIFFPLGLVFGIVALSQIKKTNEEGKGLAVAGIVISTLALFGMLIMITFISFLGTVIMTSPSVENNAIDELTQSVQALDEAIIGSDKEISYEKPIISNEDVNLKIKEFCVKEWPDDFNMRAYCQEQQTEGYNKLLKIKPTDMLDSDFQTIKTKCQNEWPNDFNMRSYCEEQQVEGWEAIQ